MVPVEMHLSLNPLVLPSQEPASCEGNWSRSLSPEPRPRCSGQNEEAHRTGGPRTAGPTVASVPPSVPAEREQSWHAASSSSHHEGLGNNEQLDPIGGEKWKLTDHWRGTACKGRIRLGRITTSLMGFSPLLTHLCTQHYVSFFCH